MVILRSALMIFTATCAEIRDRAAKSPVNRRPMKHGSTVNAFVEDPNG
jgi:hypothetical protein